VLLIKNWIFNLYKGTGKIHISSLFRFRVNIWQYLTIESIFQYSSIFFSITAQNTARNKIPISSFGEYLVHKNISIFSSCQTEDNNNYLITSSPSSSTSPSTFNNNNSSINNSGIEPLDLSISNNNKQQKQYLRKRASTATATTILLQQSFKDLNKKEEITTKKSKKELIIFVSF